MSEQTCISFVGKRVFCRLSRLSAVKVTVGKYECIGAHLFEEDPVLIDGGIDGERLRKRAPTLIKERGEDGLLDIDAIAETYWQIHRQPRSTWAHEVDLRPFKETF